MHPRNAVSSKSAEISEKQTATLPIEVTCEVVYVLQKVYGVNRKDIQQQLGNLIDENLVDMDKSTVFLKALELYGASTFDFVDTLLWAYNAVEQQEVLTFDNKLHKYIQRTAR